MADPGVQAFLDTWNSLPADYVPQYDFAYSENDGGLYAFPASPYKQAQYGSRSGQPFLYNAGDESANPLTSQALATGGVPGAVRLGGYYGNEPIDPKYAQDLAIWQQMVQGGNATRDEFSGLTANIFGNAFTLPALFAGSAMAANAFPGVATPGSLGSSGELVGGSSSESLLGTTAGDTLGTGTGSALVPELEGGTFGATGASSFLSPAVAATTAPGLLSTLNTYAPLAALGIGAVGSIVGGIQGRKAATDAAQTQADAARDANATLLAITQQNRADLAPYRAAGTGALAQLQTLTAAPLTSGPYTATAPLDPSAHAFTPTAPLDPSAYAYTPTAPLDPSAYAYTPTPVYRGPSAADLRADPGYQFRVSEGQKALERSAAGKGLLLSGGQLKDLTRFGQGQGAQEYAAAYGRGYAQNQDLYARTRAANELAYGRGLQQNTDLYGRSLAGNQLAYGRGLQQNTDVYGRSLTSNQMDYERALQQNQDTAARQLGAYTTNYNTLLGLRSQQYNELAGLSGTGQTATQTLGTLNANLGTQLAANTTSAGAATAAGQVGAQNALTGMFAGAGSAANQYLQYQLLSSLLNRKAA